MQVIPCYYLGLVTVQDADYNKNATYILSNAIHIVHVFYPNSITNFFYCVIFSIASKFFLTIHDCDPHPPSGVVKEARAMCPCQETGEAWGGVDCGIGPYSLNTRNNEVWYFVVCGVLPRWGVKWPHLVLDLLCPCMQVIVLEGRVMWG